MGRATTNVPFWLSLFLALLIAASSRYFPFFWDSIQLGAMQGDWFYQEHFQSLLLPDRIDSGHIPFFGAYLALCWQLFGQSLSVSHWAMVPALWLLFWQMIRLGRSEVGSGKAEVGGRRSEGGRRKAESGRWRAEGGEQKAESGSRGVGLLLVLWAVDPVLWGQAVMISPDIILAGAFLLAVNSILRREKGWLMWSILLLGLISLRGMMLGLGLFAWDVLIHWKSMPERPLKRLTRLVLPYLPGGLVALAYLAYHFSVKGWVGVHADSPWAGSFSLNSAHDLIRQMVVLAWRWLDYGRIFVWAGIIGMAYYFWRHQRPTEGYLPSLRGKNWGWVHNPLFKITLRPLVVLLLVLGVVLGLPALISQGLSQHRYFLPLFLILSVLAIRLLAVLPKRTVWVVYGLMVLGLASGNRWIYPDHIAQGWDATSAHIPYHEGRRRAMAFLEEQQIPLNTVGTAFPEVGPIHFRELNDQREGLVQRQLQSQNYILYSNIMNDFSDDELALLQSDWNPIFSYSVRGVEVTVFQHKPNKDR